MANVFLSWQKFLNYNFNLLNIVQNNSLLQVIAMHGDWLLALCYCAIYNLGMVCCSQTVLLYRAVHCKSCISCVESGYDRLVFWPTATTTREAQLFHKC